MTSTDERDSKPEQHLAIGREQMDAFCARLDAWLREQPVADQVLMAILTHDVGSAGGGGQRYTLPAFAPGWTRQACEWKLRLLGSGEVEVDAAAVEIEIDDPTAEARVVAKLDLDDVFHDAYSW